MTLYVFICYIYLSIYLRRVTRGGRGGGLPCPFSKIGKKCPNFGKKMPWLCPSWVKFLILNVVLRVSRRKKTHIFSLRGFSFMCCRCLSTCPDSEKTPLPWKIPGYEPVKVGQNISSLKIPFEKLKSLGWFLEFYTTCFCTTFCIYFLYWRKFIRTFSTWRIECG